jgi:hypothetical protein
VTCSGNSTSCACCPSRASKPNLTCAALRGGTVCKFHGGAAKHVRNAARVRLANAADRTTKELLHMATDDKVSDAVKRNAIRDALERAGLKPGPEVEVADN